MKNFILLTLVLLVLILFSCNHTESNKSSIEDRDYNPLVGAWLQIEVKYYTPDRDSLLRERNSPDWPFSIKVFSNNHFAYITRGEDSLNTAGSAGPYRIEGDKYIETHDWLGAIYDKKYLGSTSTYKFKINGDTLFMSGPVKSVLANGQEAKDHRQMDEIRIRTKENQTN